MLVAVSASWTRCSPAETRAGEAASESASAAGASIAIPELLAGAGARVAPVLDSVALADARQETVPLPEASNVQVKSRLFPECRTRPAVEAGCETMATAALPVVTATGGGRFESTTSAPPEFVAVSVSEGRCSPAEIRAGPATAETTSLPASCASTVALVIDPVEGVIEGSLPSTPCAAVTNATWPADVAEVVQMNETLWPPCNTATLPAEIGVMASTVAVVPVAVVGAAGEMLVASASPVFCTRSVSWSACPALTRVRSVASVALSCAGACSTRSADEGDTVAAPPPCTVPDALAISPAGPAEFAVTWNVNVAELPGARLCPVSVGPLIARLPSPGLLRGVSEAMALSTAVCPLLVSSTRRLSACPTEAVAGTPTRFAMRPPGRSTAKGVVVASPMRCAEVLVSLPVTWTWTASVPAPGAGITSNVNDSRAPPASGPGDSAEIDVGVTAAPDASVRSSASRPRPAISAPPVFETSTVSCERNPSTSWGARIWIASAPAVCTCTELVEAAATSRGAPWSASTRTCGNVAATWRLPALPAVIRTLTSKEPPAGKAQGSGQGARAVTVPPPDAVNAGNATSSASAEGGPAAPRCRIAGSTCPSVAVAGRDPVNEAVIRGGSWTTRPSPEEAETVPAPFPSCANAETEMPALPAGPPACTGMEKVSEPPAAASRATEAGDGEPALMPPETSAPAETETASTSPSFLTSTSSVADWPLTIRAGPETETDMSGPAWTSKPAVVDAPTCAPETESLPETETENVAGEAELPRVTGDSVTEPPAGTEAGGSCRLEAGPPDGPITSPEPPAAMDKTAAGTSTSPVLEITTASGTFWPFEARDCEGEAVIASAAGLRAAPEDAEAGCAANVRPESALTPESATVSCTGAPAVDGVTENVRWTLAPAARGRDAAGSDTDPSVADTVSCAFARSTSPSLRASMVTVRGTPTSTIAGSEGTESAGAGPPRIARAYRCDTLDGGSPRWATAVASSSSQPGPADTPWTEPGRERAPPAAIAAPEMERFDARAAPPPAVTSRLTWARSTSGGAQSRAESGR